MPVSSPSGPCNSYRHEVARSSNASSTGDPCRMTAAAITPPGLIHPVSAGYKTGVMEQLETGAEAKKRDPKAIIQRRITSIETPSTQLEPSKDDAIHLLTCHIVAAPGPLPPLAPSVSHSRSASPSPTPVFMSHPQKPTCVTCWPQSSMMSPCKRSANSGTCAPAALPRQTRPCCPCKDACMP